MLGFLTLILLYFKTISKNYFIRAFIILIIKDPKITFTKNGKYGIKFLC